MGLDKRSRPAIDLPAMRAQRHGGPYVAESDKLFGDDAAGKSAVTAGLVSAHTESVQPAGGDRPKPAGLGADGVMNPGSGWEPRNVRDVIRGQEPTPLTYDVRRDLPLSLAPLLWCGFIDPSPGSWLAGGTPVDPDGTHAR